MCVCVCVCVYIYIYIYIYYWNCLNAINQVIMLITFLRKIEKV